MLFRFRWLAAVVMTAAAGALGAPAAQAGFFTEQATVDVHSLSPPTGPPITTSILIDTGSGRTFTNSYGFDGSGNVLVRSVGVLVMNAITVKSTDVDSAILGPGAGTLRLVVAFALDGHTVAVPSGAPTVQFTSGGAGVWQAPAAFVRDDPTKWFNNFANPPVYGTALAPQTDVRVGFGDTLGGLAMGALKFPAAETNLSSINSVSAGLIQGTLLFNENFDPNHFLDTTTNFQGGTGPFLDSLLAISNQTIGNQTDASNLLNANTTGGGTAAQKQAVVNELAAFFGLSLLTSGAFSGNFATFGSNDNSDYKPGGPGINANDFAATATVELYSGLSTPAPEPSSIGLMVIGAVVTGLYARRRSVGKK